MNQPEIESRLTGIFRDIFDDEALSLRPEMTAADVPEWDSFNHINLIVATEAKFGIKFQTHLLAADTQPRSHRHPADISSGPCAADGK